MITSTANPKVKEIVSLQKKAGLRRQLGLFAVEGKRFVQELPPEDCAAAYATERFAESEEGRALCERLGAELVSDAVMEKMADTRTPQGILALARIRPRSLGDFGTGPVLVLEHVQDPGNLGTIFRTAEALGAGGILMDEDTADPYGPKALRATMGAVFRLPFVISSDLPAGLVRLREAGYTLFAAHLAGTEASDEIAYPQKSAFLLGNEGDGLSERAVGAADCLIRIPMEGKAESLNVAVAGALLLYEAMRQRRAADNAVKKVNI